MPNLFDSTNYPTREPDALVAGDRWAWKRTDLGTDYPPASYALRYRATLLGGAVVFSITASESGSDYLVEEASTTTAARVPGTYAWEAFITRQSDSARIRIGSGTWELKPDPATSTADPRSHPRKTLAAIEAVIERTATKEQASYSIGGHTLARRTLDELRALRTEYRIEVRREEALQAVSNGRRNPHALSARA